MITVKNRRCQRHDKHVVAVKMLRAEKKLVIKICITVDWHIIYIENFTVYCRMLWI